MADVLSGLRKPDEQVPTGAGWYNAALSRRWSETVSSRDEFIRSEIAAAVHRTGNAHLALSDAQFRADVEQLARFWCLTVDASELAAESALTVLGLTVDVAVAQLAGLVEQRAAMRQKIADTYGIPSLFLNG